MKKIQAALAACVIAAAMSAPSIAFAQFSISLTFTGTAPATCDPSGVSQAGTGLETLNLPNNSANAYFSASENGGPPQVNFQTIPGPFPQSFPAPGGFTIPSFTPLTPPYTIVETAFPAQNGVPIGTGVRVTAVCGVSSASITIEDGVPATITEVPALSTPTLAALAVMLALAGAALLRRRG